MLKRLKNKDSNSTNKTNDKKEKKQKKHNNDRETIATKLLEISNESDLKSEILKQELESAFIISGSNPQKPIYLLDQSKYPNKWGFAVQFHSLKQCLIYILTEMQNEYFSKNISFYLFSLLSISQKFLLFELGMNVKDRRWGLRIYKDCFVQIEALQWLVKSHFVKTIEDAESLGNKFINQKYIKHVTGDFDFKRVFDEKDMPRTLFFRFLTESERDSALAQEKALESKLNELDDEEENPNTPNNTISNDHSQTTHTAQTKTKTKTKTATLSTNSPNTHSVVSNALKRVSGIASMANLTNTGSNTPTSPNNNNGKKLGKHERRMLKHSQMIDLLLTRVVMTGDLHNDIFISVGRLFKLPRNRNERYILVDNDRIQYKRLEKCVRFILTRYLDPDPKKRGTAVSELDTQAAVAQELWRLCIESLSDLQKSILFAGGCDVRNRTYHATEYKKVFVGKEAVTWLVLNQFARDRKDAVRFGGLLVERGYCSHVKKEHGFKDKFLFYRFDNALMVQNETYEIYKDYRRLSKKYDEMRLRMVKYEKMMEKVKLKATQKNEIVRRLTQTLKKTQKRTFFANNGKNIHNTYNTRGRNNAAAHAPNITETEINSVNVGNNENGVGDMEVEMSVTDVKQSETEIIDEKTNGAQLGTLGGLLSVEKSGVNEVSKDVSGVNETEALSMGLGDMLNTLNEEDAEETNTMEQTLDILDRLASLAPLSDDEMEQLEDIINDDMDVKDEEEDFEQDYETRIVKQSDTDTINKSNVSNDATSPRTGTSGADSPGTDGLMGMNPNFATVLSPTSLSGYGGMSFEEDGNNESSVSDDPELYQSVDVTSSK